MKRTYIFTLLLALGTLCAHAQLPLLEKYADMDEVTYVQITKSMLRLFPKMTGEVNGLELGDVAGKLELIQILTCDEGETTAKLRKDLAAVNAKNGYEQMMFVKEDGEKTSIYFKEWKKARNELLLVQDEKDDVTVISIVGDITPEDVNGLMKE